MPRVYECIDCGAETNGTRRCVTHETEARAGRRNSGYDDPKYRRARAKKIGKSCERCGRRSATSVHHRDGEPSHNEDSNLLGVCDDCKPIVDRAMRADRATVRLLRPRRSASPWK